MNILLVTMAMDIGGAETHILELAKELKRRGNNIYVMSNGGAYVEELKESGIMHVWAPLNNKNPKNIFNSYKIIKKLIKEKNIDIIHSHARIPSFISGIVAKEMGIPFVTTNHGTYKVNFLLSLLSNWGEYTLAVSEDTKKYLLENYNVKEENIFITVNGIDTNKFFKGINTQSLKNELGIKENEKNIVYVGRLDNGRVLSVEQLINIFPSLYAKYPELNLIVVGGGDIFDELENKAREINKNIGKNKIKMVGNKTNVSEYLSLANIFVGVSRAALEAMASEVPSIIAGSDGYLGIFDESKLKDGIDTNFCCRGLQMPTEELLSKDVEILLNESKVNLEKLGKYGQEIVQRYYSVQKMANDAERVYKICAKKC